MQATPYDLTIRPVPHRNATVRKLGFDLDHPYVEQCWAPVVGPTSILLLRRLPRLWRDSKPARVDPSQLSLSLGLGDATSPNQRFWKTVDRLTQFGLARYGGDDTLEVFTKLAPLSARQLDRVPEWSRQEHFRLLDEHLDRLSSAASPNGASPTPDLTARLDRLEHPRAPDLPPLGR